MKILIDNSNLFAGGGIQVANSFISDLKEINESNNIYHIIQSPNSAKSIDKNKFSKNFIFYDLDDETTKSKTKRMSKSGYIFKLCFSICINKSLFVFLS